MTTLTVTSAVDVTAAYATRQQRALQGRILTFMDAKAAELGFSSSHVLVAQTLAAPWVPQAEVLQFLAWMEDCHALYLAGLPPGEDPLDLTDEAFEALMPAYPAPGAEPDGAMLYGKWNAVGTVSQTGGVPTGALIESGSNSEGYYVRFADGTQIVTNFGDPIGLTSPAEFEGPATADAENKIQIGRWY